MDWNNIDLTSHERESNLIDPLTFDGLLLEIACNIKTEDLNEVEIRKQFETDLQNRVREARDIFNSNLTNIVNQAKAERAKK